MTSGKLGPGKHLAYEMRLELREVEREALEEARRRLMRQGVGLTTLAAEREHDPMSVGRIYVVHNECRRHQPPAGLRVAPLTYRLWAWSFLGEAGREALPAAFFVAMEAEEYVGLSAVVRVSVATGARREPEVLVSGFTGVLPQYGGRGIGAGLKAATVLYALENGYREMRSTVLAENGPMMRINEKLGFRVCRERVEAYPLTPSRTRRR